MQASAELRFLGPRAAKLRVPVWNLERADIVGAALDESGAGCPIVTFDMRAALNALVDELRRGALLDGELGDVARRRYGYLLWGQLYPDIGTDAGTGRYASLGTKQLCLESFFSWMRKRGLGNKHLECLIEIGQDAPLGSLESWLKKIHFPVESELPNEAELAVGEKFLASCAQRLVADEQRHVARLAAASGERLTRELYKRVRRNAESLAKQHGLTQNERKAATLLSLAFREQLRAEIADDVAGNLPRRLLATPLSQRIFRRMWFPNQVGTDPKGRFDVAVMSSPAIKSILEYFLVAPVGHRPVLERLRKDFAQFAFGTAARNDAVNAFLGIAQLYRPWLEDERERERFKSLRRRTNRDRSK